MVAPKPVKKKRLKVLLADDDRVFVATHTAALAHRGWVIQTAFDAMQAVMYASQTPPPDCIVLDLAMPAGTGYNSLDRLHRSTRTMQIPVIIVTGSTEADAEQRTAMLGAAKFMHKPVTPEELAAAIIEVTDYESDEPAK
jgi:putative two-component system response regulator